ncbi:ganglioside GM2 activator-like [Argonauta hians]
MAHCYIFIAVISALVTVCPANLIWSQCGGENVFKLQDVNLSPMPMKIPGKVTLDLKGYTLAQLNGSDVSITIKKKTFIGHIKIPCLFQVGSCTYQDSCTLLKRMKDENWGGMMAKIMVQVESYFSQNNINLDCPVAKQSLEIKGMAIDLPDIPSYLSFFASGSYKIDVNMTDRRTKKQTFCLHVEFSIA